MTTKNQKLSLEEIKARIKPICICKGIKQSIICEAIQMKNCKTVEEVNLKTGSGKGGCQGRRCRPVIEKLIERNGEMLLNPHISNEEEEDF
jgi:NAD(P)H-nitrite reductase large subunit